MPHSSPFFSNNTGYSAEVKLIDDLVVEQIAMFGLDVMYMPRKHLNLDRLLHESSKSAFEVAMPLVCYVKSFDGYDNGMELLEKFGVRNSDELTFVTSRSQFTTYYGPYLKNYYEQINGGEPLNPLIGQTDARPKEGDLIYFPFDDGIFEIKYVNFDEPFFQLGKGYVFELQCEKFEYSGENFNTGYRDIDDTEEKVDYYKTKFTFDDKGEGTFKLRETVSIYSVQEFTDEDGDVITTEEGLALFGGSMFNLYNDAGYTDKVYRFTGEVMDWDLPNKELIIGNITKLDPDQEDENHDVTVNKFDNVIIVGNDSGASWYSSKAEQKDAAFTDNKLIQSEFDQIKIFDEDDDSPFGFI